MAAAGNTDIALSVFLASNGSSEVALVALKPPDVGWQQLVYVNIGLSIFLASNGSSEVAFIVLKPSDVG